MWLYCFFLLFSICSPQTEEPFEAEEEIDGSGDLFFNSTDANETFIYIEPEASPLDNFQDETFKQFFTNQNRLVEYLFHDYKRQVPAMYIADRYGRKPKPLTCNATLQYSKLLSIAEPKQSATMIIEVFLFWTDPRLAWNPSEFGGATEIALTKQDTVWIPDVLPVDVLSFTESLPEDLQIVNIYSEGTVSFYFTSIIEFVCRLNLANFPFDEQTCRLRFTSYNGPTTELIVRGNVSTTMDLDELGNGEWSLKKVTVNTVEVGGALNHNFSVIEWDITIRRSSTFYVMLMIIPSFILTVLCVFGLFWETIDGDSYLDNLNLGFAAILAMMFVLQMTTQNMPKINQIDKLSRYSMINLALIALASVLVMIMGKSKFYQGIANSGDDYPRKEKISPRTLLIVRKLHFIFMITFSVLSVINLIILLF